MVRDGKRGPRGNTRMIEKRKEIASEQTK